jgi:3-phenylpropionate/trans-cinnamate dioxygenase ferredoxin reductase subunit
MMARTCSVRVNDETFVTNCGDLLLDAALMNGIDIPHDCRSGHCGTCKVRVVSGQVFGAKGDDPEIIHACQSRVISDVEMLVEDVPEIESLSGRVTELIRLAPDVVEVCITLSRPLHYLPGQYCKVRFYGFPPRCFSPTAALDGKAHDPTTLRFHIRQVPNGCVSMALGEAIRVDHRVRLSGPFGSAFLRSDPARLVLVAGGTGFAPMWAVAHAALVQAPDRELVFVAGSATLQGLYMGPALCWLARHPNVVAIPVVEEPQSVSPVIRQGRPTDHLPALSSRDVVYTAGAPPMVKAVARLAASAGVKCHTDPFEAQSNAADDGIGLFARALDWFEGTVIPFSQRAGTGPDRQSPDAAQPSRQRNGIERRAPGGPSGAAQPAIPLGRHSAAMDRRVVRTPSLSRFPDNTSSLEPAVLRRGLAAK